MAEKLTNRTALTTPASGDLLHIVDVSDTTDSPQGSSKKITFANLAAGITPTAAALTKTDDTNVTLTLGGSPSSALLAATSLTLGWTGTLADARISSAATWNAKESALTFSTGLTRTTNTITIDSTVVTLTGSQALSNKTGLISQWTNDSGYITSSSLSPYMLKANNLSDVVSVATAKTNLSLNNVENTALSTWAGTSNITTLGTITTGTWSATAIAKAKGGTGVDISSAALVLGTSSSSVGKLTLANATNAFTQSLQGTVVSADITYNLPTTAPTAGQVLQSTAPSAGVATLSWATAAGGITVGTTTISSGTTGSIGMNIGGVYTESISYRAQQATPFSTAFGFESHSSGSFSGVKNTSIGYQAGKGIATGTDNTSIGYNAGTGITTGQYNTVIGSNSTSPSTTSSNTWIGYNAGIGVTASNVVAIGTVSGSYAGTQSVFIGNNTGTNSSGADYAVVIGNSSNTGYGTRGNIVIGYGLPTGNITASHQGVLGTTDANGYVDNWFFNGVTSASPYSVILNTCGGSGTNITGATFTISGGKGTGTGAAGDVVFQTSVKGASGTTLQSLGDSLRIIGKYVDLTESSATAFATVTVPTSGSAIGGFVHYTIEANDGTEYQSLTGYFPYSIVNKAGTLTVAIGTETQTNAVSSGTLTATASITATGTTASFKLNAVSSLTQTVLRCNSQVFKNFGTGVISAA